MASRAIGAILAVVSSLALAGALVTGLVPGAGGAVPGWWDGHPNVDGKVIERKEIRVGLVSAIGCNLGEETTCKDDLAIGSTAQLVGIGELGALGIAEILSLALLVTIARIGKRRRAIGRFALLLGLLAGGGAGALAALGPDLAVAQHVVDVPIGIGLVLAWGAAGVTAIASVIAMRLTPEPLRLKSSHAQMPALDPALANTLDVRDMLRNQHGELQPASLGPEPMMGGNNLSVPVTPLRGSPAPLVTGAPQLRPLYDVQGAAPVPAAPVLPVRAPTPLPRASIRAIAGIETPPPVTSSPQARAMREHAAVPPAADDRPETQPIEPPPPLRVPTLADESVPRKPPTAPPPLPPRPTPAPHASPAPRGSQPAMRPSQPPPLGRKTPLAGERPIADKPPEKRTIAHAIPPMPETTPPPKMTARPETDGDERRPTKVRQAADPITAVEIDAEAKAAAVAKKQQEAAQALAAAKQAALAQKHAAETAQMIEGSDTGVEVAPPVRPPTERTDQMDIEDVLVRQGQQTDASPVVPPAPRAESMTDASATPPLPEGVRATEQMQVPISTAPASLPPPKKTETVISGPTPACPQCEAPMAWVEEHLRFYCKQCKMYF